MRMTHRLAIATLLCLSSTAALAADPAPTGAGAQGRPDRQAQIQKRIDEHFDQMDGDHDGSISKTEFLAAAEERFKKLDRNGDGKITKDEREAARADAQARWQERRAQRGAGAPKTQ